MHCIALGKISVLEHLIHSYEGPRSRISKLENDFFRENIFFELQSD